MLLAFARDSLVVSSPYARRSWDLGELPHV